MCICVLVHKGSTHWSRIWSNFRSLCGLLEEIHLQKVEANYAVERPWHQLCWSGTSQRAVWIFEGEPDQPNHSWLLQCSRDPIGLHTWACSTLWQAKGICCEESQNSSLSYRWILALCRWYLCEALVQHFWKRWQSEYLTSLWKYSKWREPVKNLEVGDIVVLREDNTMATQRPIARIVGTHRGQDGLVRVVKLHTKNGICTGPVIKVVLLLPSEWSTYWKL